MPLQPDVLYLCIFKFDGGTHVMGVMGDRDKNKVRADLKQMHRGMEVVAFQVADPGDIEKAAAEVRANPNYRPIGNDDIAETEPGPVVPAIAGPTM